MLPAVGTEFADIAALLVAQAPQQQAASVLGLFVGRTRARGAAVLSVAGEQPTLFAASPGLSLRAAAVAAEIWSARAADLRAGRAVEQGRDVVYPLVENGRLLGALFVHEAEPLAPVVLEAFGTTFVKTLAAEAAGPSGAPDRIPSPGGRDGLMAALHRHEWNVARVARAFGVTRRTIYLRMQRFGIERLHVPRTNTPLRRKILPT